MVIDGKTAPGRNDNGASNRTRQMDSHQKSENESVSAHASIEEIAKMAAASDAKTMVLTHLGNQPANAGATAKRYAELGYKCKVVIAAGFLTISLDGEIFTLPEKKRTQYVGSVSQRIRQKQLNLWKII